MDARRIALGRSVRSQIALDVDRTLGPEGLLAEGFLLIGVAHYCQVAIWHLTQAKGKFVEDVFAIVVDTPRPLGVFFEGTFAPIFNLDARRAQRPLDVDIASAAHAERMIVCGSSGD